MRAIYALDHIDKRDYLACKDMYELSKDKAIPVSTIADSVQAWIPHTRLNDVITRCKVHPILAMVSCFALVVYETTLQTSAYVCKFSSRGPS